jgi:hypothetical protein
MVAPMVIGESTRRLVASQVSLELLGSFDLKGRAEAVRAYRVVSLEAPGNAATTGFVGREEELGRIVAVYERAVATPAAHLTVLLGSPGLGKSRLIGEFRRRCGERATVVAAHCDAAGGATFAPLADALRELLRIEAGAPADVQWGRARSGFRVSPRRRPRARDRCLSPPHHLSRHRPRWRRILRE